MAGFDLDATRASFERALRKLARGRAHDRAMLVKAIEFYRKKRRTTAAAWCDEQAARIVAGWRLSHLGPSVAGWDPGAYLAAVSREPQEREFVAAVLLAVMGGMHPTGRAWGRKNPTASKLRDAKHMLPAALMAKHGIGRSRAYQLCGLALRPKK
ncbi:MAG: hypothetical protein KDG55_08735 [Rhodocyclaceae bacterium]|nr:hypothetical protein [Rhodocyclaceae bacterium]